MKKREIILVSISLIFIILMLGSCLAAENATAGDQDKVDKAYKCLENQVKDKTTLSFQEAIFSSLALGGKSNLADRIDADKDTTNSCWPKAGCKIKDSAIAALAYNRVGKDIANTKKWLLSKNASASDLKWFLEIDISEHVPANCTINDGQKDNKIKIGDDMKIKGVVGSCLSIDTQGYMLRINNNCMKTEFKISCDQNFVSATLYQKGTGGTLFVLPESHSAASLGTTTEKVSSECFKTESSCDYEGTLWAALVLQKTGEDVSRFMPYLLALADDNRRYFPSSLLYILTGGDEQYNAIIQEQKQGKFWEATGTKEGRFYDTSLAMMALAGKNAAELDNARSYLLSIQTSDGCWNSNNIRDTGFVLYSGWPKAVASIGPIKEPTPCEPTFSCEKGFDCTSNGGNVLYDYSCPNAGALCCSIKINEQTCSQKNGMKCVPPQECTGRAEEAADGTCCFAACVVPEAPVDDTCTPANGACRETCESNEQESTIETCSVSGEVCCMAKGSSAWIWITLLVILIILVVLGIIFREKVKVWWFKLLEWFKTKFKKKPGAAVGPPRTGVPQRTAPYAPYGRPMPPMQRPLMQPRVPFKPARDKDMEEALKKLREMSK